MIKQKKDLNSSLDNKIQQSLRLWLGLSIVVLTLALSVWVGFSFRNSLKSAKQIVSSLLDSKDTTFTEMFLQRDLEQFLEAKDYNNLIPVNLQIKQGEQLIAEIGQASFLNFKYSWQHSTISSRPSYLIVMNFNMLPIFIFYFIFLTIIVVIYKWILSISMYSFRQAVKGASAEFESVISELRGEGTSHRESSQDLTEVTRLRNLGDQWKVRLENYRMEIERLSSVEVESRLAKQVAHDIRSPLGALRILIETHKGLNDKEFNLIKAACERIESIADELMNLANQNRQQSAKNKLMNLKARDVQKIWDTLTVEKKIEYKNFKSDLTFDFVCEWNEEDGLDGIDVSRIQRMLSNFVNNSIKASSNVIQLKLDKNKYGNRQIILSDNGSGIAPEILSQLSEQPFSLTGTGLGVSSAIRWMKELDGSLEIQSKIGEGTSIIMRFAKT